MIELGNMISCGKRVLLSGAKEWGKLDHKELTNFLGGRPEGDRSLLNRTWIGPKEYSCTGCGNVHREYSCSIQPNSSNHTGFEM